MVDEQTKLWQNVQKKVTRLKLQIKSAKDPGQLALLDEERQAVAEDSLKLNDSFSKGAEEAIDQLDLQWRIKQDEVRLGVSGQLGAMLDHARLFAERNATLSIPASQLSENLQLLNASLVSLEEKQRPFEKIDGVGLSDGQKDLLLGIRKTYDSRKATLESYDRLLASLDQATSTKILFKFTNDLGQIGFINDPVIKAAKSVLEKKEIFATLPSSVFLPSAPSQWASLGEELSHRCLPEVLSLTETQKFLAFFSERRLKAVYSHEFLKVDLNATKKLDQKQNGSWAFVNEDVKGLARKWTLRGAANWRIEFERNGGAGRYRLAQTVQEITSSGISTNTYWSYWRGVDRELNKSKDSSVLVSGELLLEGKLFPNRSQLSPESSYIYPDPGKGKVNALFSSKTIVNKPLLLFLDELKKEPIDPLVKAFIHFSFMEAMKTRPKQWGLGNSPTAKMAAEVDYEKLFSMIQGIDLIEKWHQHLLGQSIPLRQQLESFYKESGPKSYYKESRFWAKFWQEVLLSQFSFHGYCKLDGGWSKKLPNGVFAWGISAEAGDLRILTENTGEALPLTPLLVYNINPETVLRNARQSAGMSSTTDPDYLRIKASLPYPFNQSAK